MSALLSMEERPQEREKDSVMARLGLAAISGGSGEGIEGQAGLCPEYKSDGLEARLACALSINVKGWTRQPAGQAGLDRQSWSKYCEPSQVHDVLNSPVANSTARRIEHESERSSAL